MIIIMDISIFFARFLGSFFLIFGLLFIVTRQLGKTIEMTDDKAFVISTGYITLLMGLVTVILHNLWVADWRVVITLLGWFTLIKGIMKIKYCLLANISPRANGIERRRLVAHHTVPAASISTKGSVQLCSSTKNIRGVKRNR